MPEDNGANFSINFTEDKNYDLDKIFKYNKRDNKDAELVVKVGNDSEVEEGELKIKKEVDELLVPTLDDYKKYLL